jgi:hypothetical protein
LINLEKPREIFCSKFLRFKSRKDSRKKIKQRRNRQKLLKNSAEIPFHTSLTYNKLRDENEKEAK